MKQWQEYVRRWDIVLWSQPLAGLWPPLFSTPLTATFPDPPPETTPPTTLSPNPCQPLPTSAGSAAPSPQYATAPASPGPTPRRLSHRRCPAAPPAASQCERHRVLGTCDCGQAWLKPTVHPKTYVQATCDTWPTQKY